MTETRSHEAKAARRWLRVEETQIGSEDGDAGDAPAAPPSSGLAKPRAADPGERWFLVNTKAGREHLADEHLSRQGYAPFVPCTWRSIRHARKIRTCRTAYFPGYLFLPLNLNRDCWRPIDGTVGVLRIVKAGGVPLPAPIGLVEALISATDPDGVIDPGGVIKPGAAVRIMGGPFAGRLAIVDGLSGKDRVRVLMTMMNQTRPLELRRSALTMIEA